MCQYASLILLEESMSEFASVIATTEGPLHLYACPGINSHGDARAGWGIQGGAEVEWTGEMHNSLIVRYEDPKMAKTIRAMICERFQSRTELLASITETRGVDGVVQLYRDGAIWIPDDTTTGDLDLSSYAHPLPAGLKRR